MVHHHWEELLRPLLGHRPLPPRGAQRLAFTYGYSLELQHPNVAAEKETAHQWSLVCSEKQSVPARPSTPQASAVILWLKNRLHPGSIYSVPTVLFDLAVQDSLQPDQALVPAPSLQDFLQAAAQLPDAHGPDPSDLTFFAVVNRWPENRVHLHQGAPKASIEVKKLAAVTAVTAGEVMQESEVGELIVLSLTAWCQDAVLQNLVAAMGIWEEVAGQDGRCVSFAALPAVVQPHICRPPIPDDEMPVQALMPAAPPPWEVASIE